MCSPVSPPSIGELCTCPYSIHIVEMVVGSFVRLLVRRLALRKGVSLVIVCLILLGAFLLYHQYSGPSNKRLTDDVRHIVVVSFHDPVIRILTTHFHPLGCKEGK